MSRPTLPVSRLIHSRHRSGTVRTDTATMAAVTPSAIPNRRHSPRTACHTTPIPGVTLVRKANAQAPAPQGRARSARNTIPARKTWMLPRRMSSIDPGEGQHPRHPHPEQDPDRKAGPQGREQLPGEQGERVDDLGEGRGVDVRLVVQPRNVVQAAGPRVPDPVRVEHRSVGRHGLGVGDQAQPDRGDVGQPGNGQRVPDGVPAGERHGKRSGSWLITIRGWLIGPPKG